MRSLPSGRHGLSPEYVAAHQRARLLAAVREVCAERDYAQASIVQIVRRAGVSQRVFYRHFASKQECFLAALPGAVQELEAALASAPARPAEPALCLTEPARPRSAPAAHLRPSPRPVSLTVALALRALLAELDSHPVLARTLFVDALCAGEAALRLRADALARASALLPAPPGAPPQAREAALGGVVETIYHLLLEDRAGALAAMWEELAYCLLVGLVGHERAVGACARVQGLDAIVN
jgi:AcrR family transcriptional regulator